MDRPMRRWTAAVLLLVVMSGQWFARPATAASATGDDPQDTATPAAPDGAHPIVLPPIPPLQQVSQVDPDADALVTAGRVIGYVGLGTMAVGAVLVLAILAIEPCEYEAQCESDRRVLRTGLGIGIVGLGITVTGIVLITVGQHRGDGDASASRRGFDPPVLAVTPVSASIRWSF